MADYALATIDGPSGLTAAAIVVEERVHPLPGEPSMRALLDDWDGSLERIERQLSAGELGEGIALADAKLTAPLPEPRNLFMAGANYADHAREMRGLPADAAIEPPPQGPFFFLKPTGSVIGPGDAVIRPDGASKLDWEVELAAVVGTRARNLSEADALGCIAGYTVVNDISVRDLFKREPAAEPPMTFDWFMQKGWATSCPIGPWIVPARFCLDPGKLALRLLVNGETEQSSTTAEMIFSLQQQIAFLTRIVELRPGDVIATGTPAGVGMGKGRFLQPGDVVVAEIDGIGSLRNTVSASV